MFSVKKKEASPLYRKLRLNAPTRAAIKDTTRSTAGSRRVRSAEVFTLRSEWTKSPKVNIQGGELLASDAKPERNGASASASSYSQGRVRRRGVNSATNLTSGGNEFCVTNSLDKTNTDAITPTMARVNHDALDRKLHPSLTKRAASATNANNGNNPHSTVMLSPRGHLIHQSSSGHSGWKTQASKKTEQNQPLLTGELSPSAMRRVQSASVLRPTTTTIREEESADDRTGAYIDINDSRGGRHHSAKTLPHSHKVSESQHVFSAAYTAANGDESGVPIRHHKGSSGASQRATSANYSNVASGAPSASLRATSASMRSLKTTSDLMNTSMGEMEEIINDHRHWSSTNEQLLDSKNKNSTSGEEGFPTFCGKCSGIYSGNAPPPPTPVTCLSCVHGITLNGKVINGAGNQNETSGPSNAEIQKQLAQRLVHTQKLYKERIKSANVQLKMSENRVSEDSIHYMQERNIVRDRESGKEKLGALQFREVSDQSDNFPPDDSCDDDNGAHLSFQNCDDNDNKHMNYVSFDIDHEDKRGTCEQNERRGKSEQNGDCQPTNDKTDDGRKIPKVTIVTTDEEDDHKNNTQDDEEKENDDEYCGKLDSITSEDGEDHDHLSASMYSKLGRGNRRMSIHFTYKPEVGNISISNKLLHFLTIDDCKQAMRYHPHKVLEKHEVTENHLQMLENLQNGMTLNGSSDDRDSSNGKVAAMRISKGSTITTLPFSSANDATNANKKQYKILFDPEDLDYYKNRQPDSHSLAKAFNTLIYDRTIMTRLGDNYSNNAASRGSPGKKTKAVNTVGRAAEGPKYRQINAALKKQMGDHMAAQCQQMVYRYQRQKSGLSSVAKGRGQARTSSALSSDRSLSLESLPTVKQGVWRDSCDSLQQ